MTNRAILLGAAVLLLCPSVPQAAQQVTPQPGQAPPARSTITAVRFVYTHNWLEDANLDTFSTVNRRAASKIIYTQRF